MVHDPKTYKLSTIVKHLKGFDEEKSDGLFTTEMLGFNPDTCDIATPATLFAIQEEHALTDYALSRLCARLGPPPTKYMKECPPHLRATNLNHWMRKQPADKGWFLRFDGSVCRAVLSDQYTVFDNSTLAEGLLEIMGDGYSIIRPYYDHDSLHLKFVTMSDPGDGNYAYGVYVGNGEIGNRALTVGGFVQRHSCTNSIILTDKNWRQEHRYGTTHEFLLQAKIWMMRAAQFSIDAREQFAKKAMDEIGDFADVVSALCKRKGLTNEVRDNVLIGSEGAGNLFGLVNGLSWAAHQQDDQELGIELETLAGDVMLGRVSTRRERVLSILDVASTQEEI